MKLLCSQEDLQACTITGNSETHFFYPLVANISIQCISQLQKVQEQFHCYDLGLAFG